MEPITLIETLRAHVPGATYEPVPAPDYTTIYVSREHIVQTLRVLRDEPGLSFMLLSELTAVDYLPRDPRFDVVYHLTRLGVADFPRPGVEATPARIRLKVKVGDGQTVPTCIDVFACANWLEREVWDLFGIVFEGHPDLRRLLLPDDWDGFPLRKDYPVQVKTPYMKTEAVELTEEEFLANVQRQRAGSQPPRR